MNVKHASEHQQDLFLDGLDKFIGSLKNVARSNPVNEVLDDLELIVYGLSDVVDEMVKDGCIGTEERRQRVINQQVLFGEMLSAKNMDNLRFKKLACNTKEAR